MYQPGDRIDTLDSEIQTIDVTQAALPAVSSADCTTNVRAKANGTVLASAAATVTIGEHACAAQEGWHSDETNHWNTCECGEKLNEAAHTFEWVIDKEAAAAGKGLFTAARENTTDNRHKHSHIR